MNCPLDWTNAFGFAADSVASDSPATPNRAGRVGIVGDSAYRLVRTIPTA